MRLPRICILFVIFVAISALLPSRPSAAESKRVAFVVGIGTYDNLAADKQLRNPVHDAEGVSAKLAEIGFQVTKALNLTRSAFNSKWQSVLDSLGTDDTFVLFFSSHGVQIDGQNYLLPRDIPFIEYGRQAQLTREAISLNEILTELTSGDRPHPKQSVVILDACRDNPLIPPGYKSVSTPRGLAKVPESDGIFVLYSAGSNRTALDRLSPNDPVKNSVFTRALLPLLGHKDLSIQELSTRLKDEVWTLAKTVKHDQRPTYYDGILGRFCLPGCIAKAEKEPGGLKDNVTIAVVRPSSSEKITDKVNEDSLPAPQSPEPTQPLAMKQNVPLSEIQPTENLPSAITGKDGAPMVLVPAGEFMMGSRKATSKFDEDEVPAHPVYLDAYYIDQYEVTAARYAKSGARLRSWMPKVEGNKPVAGVDWNDATAYCAWAGKRLPTEAEWEKAARGTDERLYPWGNREPDKTLANFSKVIFFTVDGVLVDVGSFEKGKSPYGAYDMSGNVQEWVSDWYDKNYYSKSPPRNPKGPSSGERHVARGGSWDSHYIWVNSTDRKGWGGEGTHGFRCAQDAPK